MGNSAFSQTTVNAPSGFGFQYRPGDAITYRPIENTTPKISVVLPKNVFDPRVLEGLIPAASSDTPPLFGLPASVNANWKNLVKNYDAPLAKNTDFLKRTQGYLQYCHDCLEMVNHTACGNTVIAFLNQPGRGVNISPASFSNSIRGASADTSFPPLAKKLLEKDSRFTEEVDGLVAKAHAKFKGEDETASLNAMAAFMNKQPLYSLFKAPAYEYSDLGFLATNFSVTGLNLRDWFTGGVDSEFAKLLQNGIDTDVDSVSVHEYTRLMAIVALEDQFLPGTGNTCSIAFNTNRTNMNTERPAAVGLGHELVHCYWATKGQQLGIELGKPSTLLFELKCVGLGPWADSEISENSIRGQWEGANGDAIARRTAYELADPDSLEGRISFRTSFQTI